MTPDDFPSHSNGKHPDPSGNQAAVCHDWKEDESPSLAVVNAIAAATGTTQDRLQPLYKAIDPEALDMLFESAPGLTRRASQRSVSFRHEGCDVLVQSNGQLFIWLRDEKHDE